MSKSHAIKLSGWAFMLASFGFLAVNNDSTAVSFAGLVFNSIPLLVGMLGLRAGYGDRVGSFGRNILLVGVLGMVLAFVSGSVLNRIQPRFRSDTPGLKRRCCCMQARPLGCLAWRCLAWRPT